MEGIKYTRGSLFKYVNKNSKINGYRVEMEYLTLRHLIRIKDDILQLDKAIQAKSLEFGDANDVSRGYRLPARVAHSHNRCLRLHGKCNHRCASSSN